jgi:hypothetical protein
MGFLMSTSAKVQQRAAPVLKIQVALKEVEGRKLEAPEVGVQVAVVMNPVTGLVIIALMPTLQLPPQLYA